MDGNGLRRKIKANITFTWTFFSQRNVESEICKAHSVRTLGYINCDYLSFFFYFKNTGLFWLCRDSSPNRELLSIWPSAYKGEGIILKTQVNNVNGNLFVLKLNG